MAAQDLMKPGNKIIEVAARYRYDTPESFSKAFTRFHGVPPSKARLKKVRVFNPMTINISTRRI
jgi:AraC-like DNA-binding protein